MGPTTHCVRWGEGLWPHGGRGYWGSNIQPKHAIANCCCHMANKNEKRFHLFPNYTGLVIIITIIVIIVTNYKAVKRRHAWANDCCRGAGIEALAASACAQVEDCCVVLLAVTSSSLSAGCTSTSGSCATSSDASSTTTCHAATSAAKLNLTQPLSLSLSLSV